MKFVFSIIIFTLSLTSTSLLATDNEAGANVQPDNLFPRVLLETSVGKVVVELDRNRAPITSNNFLTYVISGHYDQTIFHRVIKDFVVQGGGYDGFYSERPLDKSIFNESGNGLKNKLYTLAMARDEDPHSATSQFYINMADNAGLDPGKDWGYTVFGLVMEGEEVLDLISGAQTHTHPQLGWEDVPKTIITLKKASVIAEE